LNASQHERCLTMTGKSIFARILFSLAFIWVIGVLSLSGQDDQAYTYHNSKLDELGEKDQWNYLLDIYSSYGKTDPSLILRFAGRIEPLGLAFGSQEEIAGMYKKIGYAYYESGKPIETIHFMKKVLDISGALHDTVMQTSALTYLGAAENKISHYNLALEFYLDALKLESCYFDSLKIHQRTITDWNTRGDILNGSGNVHFRMGNRLEAIGFYNQALSAYRYAADTCDLANVYNNIGITHLAEGRYTEAMSCFLDGLKFTGETGFDKERSLLYSNIGNTYWFQEKYREALGWMLKHLEINRKLGNIANLSSACNNVGGLYMNLGEYDLAEQYLLEGLALAREAHFLMSVQQNLLALSDLEEERQNPELALNYYKQYVAVKDSILNEKVTSKVAEMQTRFDTERISNELQLESLRVKNRERLILAIVIILGFILITIYLLFNRYKLRQRHQKNKLEKQYLDIEQRLLRSQMNPHFIFNSLNSIKGYMLNSKTGEAAEYLDKFATLMRLNLTNSREPFIPLSDDIKALEINLELEKLRFRDKFSFEIDIDPDIDPERIFIPPMLAQPYVENAILHGLAKKENHGTIWIRYQKKQEQLQVIIEDNGIGRKASGEFTQEVKKGGSLGMQLTLERFELLKQERGVDISVEITDLSNESGEACGTRVELKIPFEEE